MLVENNLQKECSDTSTSTLQDSNRRCFFKGVYQCALVAVSIRLTACGSEESLSRRSILTKTQSDDSSQETPNQEEEGVLNQEPILETPDETKNPTEEEITPEDPIEDSQEPQTMTLLLSDVMAISLYYDGTMGPQTGVITVDDLVLAQDKAYEFWHGHGGTAHSFVVTAEDFKNIREGNKVTIETNSVDSHSHTLFIDPSHDEFKVTGTTREVEIEVEK